MTEFYYRTGNYKVDPTTFGGEIYLSDFETDYRGKDNNNGSVIASRIQSASRFDEHCRKNLLGKERNRK